MFDKYYEEIRQYLKTIVDEGEFNVEGYIFFVDYANVQVNNYQIYGKYNFSLEDTKTYRKIKDSENIDKLRSEIGLIELKYDALYLNYQLPVGYKFKGE